jgi:hypothetical protein
VLREYEYWLCVLRVSVANISAVSAKKLRVVDQLMADGVPKVEEVEDSC